MNDKMRENFEAWFKGKLLECGGAEVIHRRNDKLLYKEGFQAGYQAALTQQAEPEVSQPVDQQLLDFYNVKTANELIAIQEHHIKRLQEKLSALDGGKNAFRPTFPRG